MQPHPEQTGDTQVAPTDEIKIFCFIAYGSAFCNRNNLGASRKITVKAKILIEYPLSIVGTGVLDCPDMQTVIDMLRPVI